MLRVFSSKNPKAIDSRLRSRDTVPQSLFGEHFFEKEKRNRNQIKDWKQQIRALVWAVSIAAAGAVAGGTYMQKEMEERADLLEKKSSADSLYIKKEMQKEMERKQALELQRWIQALQEQILRAEEELKNVREKRDALLSDKKQESKKISAEPSPKNKASTVTYERVKTLTKNVETSLGIPGFKILVREDVAGKLLVRTSYEGIVSRGFIANTPGNAGLLHEKKLEEWASEKFLSLKESMSLLQPSIEKYHISLAQGAQTIPNNMLFWMNILVDRQGWMNIIIRDPLKQKVTFHIPKGSNVDGIFEEKINELLSKQISSSVTGS